MSNVVPMDSKLLSNYWYMSWPSWPTHISKLCSHKKRTSSFQVFDWNTTFVLSSPANFTFSKPVKNCRKSYFICSPVLSIYEHVFRPFLSNVKKVGNMIPREQVTQKVHQLRSGSNFWSVLRPQTHRGTCGATPFLRAQKIGQNG